MARDSCPKLAAEAALLVAAALSPRPASPDCSTPLSPHPCIPIQADDFFSAALYNRPQAV